MKINYLKHHKLIFNPTGTLRQGIGAAPKAYFAKYGAQAELRKARFLPKTKMAQKFK